MLDLDGRAIKDQVPYHVPPRSNTKQTTTQRPNAATTSTPSKSIGLEVQRKVTVNICPSAEREYIEDTDWE